MTKRVTRTQGRPARVREAVDQARRESDGWWVDEVLDAFGFLESEHGWALVDVQLHFRGNFVRFTSRTLEFVVEFNSELELLLAEFWSHARERRHEPHVLKIWNLLGSRDPSTTYVLRRADYPSTVAWVAASLRRWAAGLQLHAPDVLEGREDADLPWTE